MSCKYSISVVVTSLETRETILLSNIYAPIDFSGKQHLWSHIRCIQRYAPLFPWIVVDDFNAITNLNEKKGGILRLEPDSFLLQDNISTLNLVTSSQVMVSLPGVTGG